MLSIVTSLVHVQAEDRGGHDLGVPGEIRAVFDDFLHELDQGRGPLVGTLVTLLVLGVATPP